MLRNKQLFLLLTLLTTTIAFAQSETIFNSIKFNDTRNSVIKKIEEISASTKLVNVKSPSFSIAKKTESHLIAENVNIKNEVLKRVVFTFSDGVLSFISVKGNVKILEAHQNEQPKEFINFQVYFKSLLFLNLKEDKAWFLTNKSVHPNLFAWSNPYLNKQFKKPTYNSSARLPKFLSMGENYSKALATFKKKSLFIQIDTLDGKDPNAQIQINSFGIEFAGFPRKFEARFGDNKLNVIWVLTAKEEENRVRKELIKAYGKPVFKNNDWEIYNNWTVGLRKDKPEVLFLTQKLGLKYKKEIFKQ